MSRFLNFEQRVKASIEDFGRAHIELSRVVFKVLLL